MDWNWFFSSLAQSVAALVGVVGAFLISSLLNNQASYAKNRSRTGELLRESQRLVDAANSRSFDWYNERALEYALSDVELTVGQVQAQDVRTPEDYYAEFNFPDYLPKKEILEAIEGVLQTDRERREEIERREREEARKRARSMGLGFDPPDFSLKGISMLDNTAVAAGRLVNQSRLQMYDQEREAILQLMVAIKGHIRAAREHLALIEQQPESSTVIRAVLGAVLLLFWFGVIYPLSFLPVPSTGVSALSVRGFFDILFSLRGLLLTLATLVFTGLIAFLGISNERLRHPEADVAKLRDRLQPESYSEYLRVRIENGIPL